MIIEVGALFFALAAVVLVLAIPVIVIWLVFRLLFAVGWLLAKVFAGLGRGLVFVFRTVFLILGRVLFFVRSEVVDSLRIVGAALTTVVMVPMVVANVFLGRWSAANHYGRAVERELKEFGVRVYRVAFANPIRLFGLQAVTEGLEQRLPDVVAKAPHSDRPRGGRERFEGYVVTGALPRGGSGARLYLAEPLPEKYDDLARTGVTCPGQVVIKSFSLEEGSSLPQIVRESRALDAARKLGLVLDHRLEGDSFYYVMPYVPGEDLADVIRDLHRKAGDLGLKDRGLAEGVGYVAQLLETLDRFHRGGLWHKDIKPGNVIVANDGRAHLVDFGLVTPLRSAMTLTTHGTEYFRDPEIVRLAMQGVKVHEVDGVKFDIYSTGAVLYSIIENSFPAHGSLSRITKRCPESLRWIVRRAMADTKNRYASAREMLADIRTVMEAEDPFAVQPADLVSIAGGALPDLEHEAAQGDSTFFGRFGAPFGSSRRKTAGMPVAARTASQDPSRPKQKSLRRKISAGVFAALVLFAFMGGGAIAYVASARHHGWSIRVPYVDARATGIGDYVREILPEGFRILHGNRLSRARPTASVGARARSLPPVPANYDVLVVNDLPTANPVVDRVRRSLEQAEIDVHGIALGPLTERELAWLAEARKAAGIGPRFPAEAIERLQELLAVDEELDAILWLSVGEHGDDPVYRVVTPDTAPHQGAAYRVLK
ncbi:MAG: hypothetical protein E2O39_16765 [Planctomycetota bacterium]|nr:MAG: hypothetical protein E2O39_16765 [Planctomycetota bacterium]